VGVDPRLGHGREGRLPHDQRAGRDGHREARLSLKLIGKPSHRALLIADGYIEWKRGESRKAPRQPFIHRVDGGEPFAFPALWTRSEVGSEWIESVTLITTDANAVARQVHDRMSVILPGPAEEELWLTGELEDVLELLKPIAPDRLTVAPTNPALHKVGGVPEGPALLVAPAQT
jgi:putative SOS response-associated peptidase YedK